MSTYEPTAENTNATTAAQPTNKTIQAERATPVAVDGAMAIFVPAYTRTDDGAALEQVRDELTHLVGVYSEPDVRNQLGEEYDPSEITRAIERGERMTREHPDNATAAIRVAEKNEERGVDTGEGIATDGGTAATDDDSGYNHTPSIEARANTRAVAWRNRRLKDRIESVAGERPAEVHDGRRRVTVRFEHVDEDMMAALSEAFGVQSVGISKREKIRGDERTVTRYDVLYLDSAEVST